MSDSEVVEEPGSTLLIALHVLMYTTLLCGLIAIMVVVLITPTR